MTPELTVQCIQVLVSAVLGMIIVVRIGKNNDALYECIERLKHIAKLVHYNTDVTFQAKSSADISRGYARDLHGKEFGTSGDRHIPRAHLDPEATIPQEFTIKPVSQPPSVRRRAPSDSGFQPLQQAADEIAEYRERQERTTAHSRQPSRPDPEEILDHRGRYPRKDR